MGTAKETGGHFVIIRPQTSGRGQKAVISVSPSQNCCRTESTVGKVQVAAKSGGLVV